MCIPTSNQKNIAKDLNRYYDFLHDNYNERSVYKNNMINICF